MRRLVPLPAQPVRARLADGVSYLAATIGFGVVAAIVVGVVAATVAGLVLAPVSPAAGHPPPRPLCEPCNEGFELAADDHGAYVVVQHSAVTFQAHANETLTGVAHVEVDSIAATDFRENGSLLDEIATTAFEQPDEDGGRDHDPLQGASVNDVHLDGDTVVVRFVVPDAAHRGLGDVVYTDLLRSGGQGGLSLHSNVTRLVGPDGTTVTRVPGGGSISATVASWHESENHHLADEGYVAWSDGGVRGVLATETTIWLDEAAVEYPSLLESGGPGVVVASGVVAVLVGARRRFETPSVRSVRALAGTYAVVAVASLVLAVVVGFQGAFWLSVAFLAVVPATVVPAVLATAVAVGSRVSGDTSDGAVGFDAVDDLIGVVPTGALSGLPVLAVLGLVLVVATPVNVALWGVGSGVLLVGALGLATTRGRGPTVAVAGTFAIAPACIAPSLTAPASVNAYAVVAWVLLVALAGIPLFAVARTRGPSTQLN